MTTFFDAGQGILPLPSGPHSRPPKGDPECGRDAGRRGTSPPHSHPSSSPSHAPAAFEISIFLICRHEDGPRTCDRGATCGLLLPHTPYSHHPKPVRHASVTDYRYRSLTFIIDTLRPQDNGRSEARGATPSPTTRTTHTRNLAPVIFFVCSRYFSSFWY